MAADPVFVDTNVLVYADQAGSAFHARARAAIGRLEREGTALWISRQVLREYMVSVTRPTPAGVPPMTRAEAAAAVEGFLTAYAVAEDGPAVMARLVELVRSVPVGGKQIHDANIVATMRVHGIARLLSRGAKARSCPSSPKATQG